MVLFLLADGGKAQRQNRWEQWRRDTTDGHDTEPRRKDTTGDGSAEIRRTGTTQSRDGRTRQGTAAQRQQHRDTTDGPYQKGHDKRDAAGRTATVGRAWVGYLSERISSTGQWSEPRISVWMAAETKRSLRDEEVRK